MQVSSINFTFSLPSNRCLVCLDKNCVIHYPKITFFKSSEFHNLYIFSQFQTFVLHSIDVNNCCLFRFLAFQFDDWKYLHCKVDILNKVTKICLSTSLKNLNPFKKFVSFVSKIFLHCFSYQWTENKHSMWKTTYRHLLMVFLK